MKHPIQPLETDEDGRIRFKENAICRFLLDKGPYTMTTLAKQKFSNEDFEQFLQLIGYSLNGLAEYEFVSDETIETAEKMHADGKSELEARNEFLRDRLEAVKTGLRDTVALLYNKNPIDLR